MSVAITETSPKAGFVTRALALVIDGVVLTIASSIVSALLFSTEPGRGLWFGTLLGLVYFAYFWSGQGHGRTPGMRAMNLHVVRTDGSELTVIGALIRYVGLIVSFAVLFLGVIWVAFDAQNQGWHDKLAGTYVVRTS